MRLSLTGACSGLLILFILVVNAAELDSNRLVLPDGLGVNIHFTHSQPGEMKMIADGGFRWVRMDFAWSGIEKNKGEYDFSAYDGLIAELEPQHIHAVFILDYSNKLYDDGASPSSDEGRKAFAKWAAESVKHFKDKGILWEMYNEPNISFWKPKPNVDDYIKLAIETGKAIRDAAPAETYIGPATSEIGFSFLESCFKAGVLEYWSAVSVHPYRQTAPETVADDYRRIRALITKYGPPGKTIPILSGEWGYSAAWGKFDPEKQGKYLPRQWLTNLSNGVPLSIWYDWHDDGNNPKEAEHHFGTVLNEYKKDKDPVYEPKPAYTAAKTLTHMLDGYQFNKRIALYLPDDYLLLFTKGNDIRLVSWTSAAPHQILIPASPGVFQITGHLGESLPAVTANDKGLLLNATDAPQYLVPEKPNDLLALAAAWDRLPLELVLPAQKHAPISFNIRNPLDHAIKAKIVGEAEALNVEPGATAKGTNYINIMRSADPFRPRIELDIAGLGKISQDTRVVTSNPLRTRMIPSAKGNMAVRVENPSGEKFNGTLALCNILVSGNNMRSKLEFNEGETEKTVNFSFHVELNNKIMASIFIYDEKNDPVLNGSPVEFVMMDDFRKNTQGAEADGYKAEPDGDAKVGSTQSLTADLPKEGGPVPGMPAMKLAYHFDKGWKFLRVVPQRDELKTLAGEPRELSMWIYGDGEKNRPRMRFTDSTGQTFQPTSEAVDWKGWRYISFPMKGENSGHWGGANDGVVHYPIHLDTLFLLDSQGMESTGEIFIAGPVLIQ